VASHGDGREPDALDLGLGEPGQVGRGDGEEGAREQDAGPSSRRPAEAPGLATVESLQEGGLYSTSVIPSGQVDDRDTLIALDLRGEPLPIDHGWPARLIGPNRPGVAQTKWVGR
jgi:DMSO/TMAO reductase YedYZ molybdopterin-dependent catalytic subunit